MLNIFINKLHYQIRSWLGTCIHIDLASLPPKNKQAVTETCQTAKLRSWRGRWASLSCSCSPSDLHSQPFLQCLCFPSVCLLESSGHPLETQSLFRQRAAEDAGCSGHWLLSCAVPCRLPHWLYWSCVNPSLSFPVLPWWSSIIFAELTCSAWTWSEGKICSCSQNVVIAGSLPWQADVKHGSSNPWNPKYKQ